MYHLAQIFCKPYIVNGSNESLLGLPLRLNTNLEVKLTRSSLSETYGQILKDLLEAEELLPDTSISDRFPSKAANEGLLARIFLIQGNYDQAYEYSTKALQKEAKLMDYKESDYTLSYPFSRYSKEVIFQNTMSTCEIFNSLYEIDSNLYLSYKNGDLRKQLYFSTNNSRITFRGSYDGTATFSGGIATDELYLIKAETEARLGKTMEARETLLYLLTNRFSSSELAEASL